MFSINRKFNYNCYKVISINKVKIGADRFTGVWSVGDIIGTFDFLPEIDFDTREQGNKTQHMPFRCPACLRTMYKAKIRTW